MVTMIPHTVFSYKMPLMLSEGSPLKAALRVASRHFAKVTGARRAMYFPTYSPDVARRIEEYHDEVRYASIALAIQRLEDEQIAGAFAELGVYRGLTSAFIHRQAPDRRLYLFDTFEGFPAQDLEVAEDVRFRDTSQELVARALGDVKNIEFRKGYFPETATGLEGETFAFVMLDLDLYRSALEAFNFFYPRLVRGGYFFMHDFNSTESDHAISRAAQAFFKDKPEVLVEIPDHYGTALFRKI